MQAECPDTAPQPDEDTAQRVLMGTAVLVKKAIAHYSGQVARCSEILLAEPSLIHTDTLTSFLPYLVSNGHVELLAEGDNPLIGLPKGV